MNKKILIYFGIIMSLFIISFVSADLFKFDNKVDYSKDDMKATLYNFFIFGAKMGSVELKSHETANEIREVMPGDNRAVMWYEFSDWNEVYKNGFGDVQFIDMNTGKTIKKNYYFAKEILEEKVIDDLENVCANEYDCKVVKIGEHTTINRRWEKIDSKDIPKEKMTVALITDVKEGDKIDGVWTIAGKQIKEHAIWNAALTVNLKGYYKLDEIAPDTVALDSINHHHNGTLFGSAFFIPSGKNNGAMNSTEAGLLNLSTELWNMTSSNMTVSFWLWMTANVSGDVGNIWDFRAGGGDIYFRKSTATLMQFGGWRAGNAAKQFDIQFAGGLNHTWHHYVLQMTNDTMTPGKMGNATAWLDGNIVGSDSSNNWTMGAILSSNNWSQVYGKIDELAWYDDYLAPNLIQDLYDSGVGTFYELITDISPTVALDAPVNNTNSSSNTVWFNCTASDDWKINNLSLILNGIRNYTYIDGIDNETNLTLYRNIEDGSYNWSCQTFDNSTTIQNTTAGNWTITVDTILPQFVLSQINRTVDYHRIKNNLTLNWTYTELHPGTCLIEWELENLTIPCTDNNVSLNMTNFVNKSIVFYMNDTFGNENWSKVYWNYKIFQYELNYSNTTIEGSLENFRFNITKSPDYSISQANLIYNNTINSITFTNAINQILQKNISIDMLDANANLTFYLAFNFSGTTPAMSPPYNQSVKILGIDDCSSFTNQLFNITLYDEDGQYLLVNSTENTSIELTFEISSISTGGMLMNYSNISKSNSYRVCLQNQLSNSSTYYLDGVIGYSARERFHEFYNFQKYLLSLTTSNLNLSLYNLNSTKGQEFKITYKDANFVPVSDAIIQIQRKYISEGIFKTVEIPKTGAEGYTMGHLVINDIIYNFVIMKEGSVLGTFTDVVANCQIPALQECTINLNGLSSSKLPSDFSTSDDLTFTLEYNKTTREVSSLFSIISGATVPVSMNVTLFDTLGNTTVCNDMITGAGGQLTCTVPLAFGNATIVAQIYKSGRIVGQSVISLNQNPTEIYGSSLLFLVIFAVFIIIGISISDNPMVYGIVFALGSFVIIVLNLIYTPSIIGFGATILYFIIAIVIVLIKGSNRQ